MGTLILPHRRLWVPNLAPLWFAKKRWRNAAGRRIRFSAGGARMYSDDCCCAPRTCDEFPDCLVEEVQLTIAGLSDASVSGISCASGSCAFSSASWTWSNLNGSYLLTKEFGSDNCYELVLAASCATAASGIKVAELVTCADGEVQSFYITSLSVCLFCDSATDPDTMTFNGPSLTRCLCSSLTGCASASSSTYNPMFPSQCEDATWTQRARVCSSEAMIRSVTWLEPAFVDTSHVPPCKILFPNCPGAPNGTITVQLI
jgi:hypothetical protein